MVRYDDLVIVTIELEGCAHLSAHSCRVARDHAVNLIGSPVFGRARSAGIVERIPENKTGFMRDGLAEDGNR